MNGACAPYDAAECYCTDSIICLLEGTTMNIAQIMTPKVCTAFIHENCTVRQGLEIMQRYHYTALPVLNEGGEYIGCITEGDFLRHMLAVGTTNIRAHEKYYIRDVFRPDFCKPLNISADHQQVTETILQQNFVPIVDDRGYFCGIVTRRAYIEFIAEENDRLREAAFNDQGDK